MFDFRLLAGSLATLAALMFVGLQIIRGDADVAALARGEAPRIELSVMEKPLPAQQPIKVPVWNVPPAELALQLIPFLDIVNDTKMEVAAVAIAKPVVPAIAKPIIPAIVTADVEADTTSDPLFVAAATAAAREPAPAVAKPEPVKTVIAPPPPAPAEPPAVLAKLNEVDLESIGSITLPETVAAPLPRVAPEPARPIVRQQQPVIRQAARPALTPATPQPLAMEPYASQSSVQTQPPLPTHPTPQTQQTPPNPLAVLFPYTPGPTQQVAVRPQPQPQPLFGPPAPPAQPVKYPPLDTTAVGTLKPCCTPRHLGGGD